MLSSRVPPARDPPPAPAVVQRIDRRPRALLAIATSAVLLGWILTQTSFTSIFAAIGNASLPGLLAAYAVTFGAAVISVYRWRLLLRAQGATLPGRFLMQSYMIGFFFNNFLPSTVGGDASRAYDCYRATGGNQGAMSSVLVDRLLGLLALATLALVCLPLATPVAAHLPGLSLWLGFAALGVAALIGAIFFAPPSQRLAPAAASLPLRLRRGLAVVAAAFDLYRGRWRTLLAAFALSLLLQLSVVLYYILVAEALGLSVPKLDFGLIVPLVLFIVMLPISLNGLGLRENAFAVILGFYGVATADAVALAWLVYAGTLLFTLIGGLVYATRRRPGPRTGNDADRPGDGGAWSALAATGASVHPGPSHRPYVVPAAPAREATQRRVGSRARRVIGRA
jgi:glycosyltransferase 2 family protein